MKQIENHLAELQKAILEAIHADDDLAHRVDLLKSVPGITEISVMAILIEMPELGRLNAKEIACLAGLAPAARQSGKWQARRVSGGT